MKEIITDVEKLSDIAEEIKDIRKNGVETRNIVLELKEIIRDKNLKALSAPQIGYNKRIFVIRFGKEDLRSFINPMIDYSKVKGMNLSIEEDPSIPGKKFLLVRNSKIPVVYMTPLGKIETAEFNGMASYIFQQMIHHLDGVLISDLGLEVDDDFVKASDKEKAPIIKAYLYSLDIKRKSIEEEIDKSDNLIEIKNAGEFLESVNRGETKVNVTQEKLPPKIDQG